QGPRIEVVLASAVNANTITADQAMMVAVVAAAAGGQAQTALSGLISSGAVSADAAMHFLATQAVRIGDSDSYAPTGFSGLEGSWAERDLTAPLLEAIHYLVSGSSSITMAAAVNDIVA